jgi:FtsP/CotA-like multicopper oxidase with cupredoxin domain
MRKASKSLVAMLGFVAAATAAQTSAQELPTATTPKPEAPAHVGAKEVKERGDQLRESFIELDARLRQDGRLGQEAAVAPAPPVAEGQLPAPQRQSIAAASTLSFRNPDEIHSANGELRVTLVAMKTHGRIGDDPVFLRSYNGKLVGPTLRARPGDILRITLRNDLPPEDHHVGMLNRLNRLNTTNLHTHGLHVSPRASATTSCWR